MTYTGVSIVRSILMLTAFSMLFSCAKTDGVAPSLSSTSPDNPAPTLPSDGTSTFALAYGSSAQDRQFLSDRIAGYQAPGLSVVFSQWRRFAGANIYNTTADIVQTPSYCFSGFDANHNWLQTTYNSSTISPGTYNSCVSSDPFVASSWSYIDSPDRIYNAANGTDFNGFISALKFSKFSNQATLTSNDTDDDDIGLIIAAVIDSSNNVHTLTAMRTQGGMVPTLGWAIVYKKNNAVVRTFGDKSVGGVNTNGSQGDKLGWNGRKTVVRIERDGDLVTAYASAWDSLPAGFDDNDASKITLDLSDASLGLSVFQGEQYYGYGTMSQLGATFTDINFVAPNSAADPTYIYDLVSNTVYVKQSNDAGYVVVPGAKAYSILGYPKRIKNNETQKEFMINSDSSYTEL